MAAGKSRAKFRDLADSAAATIVPRDRELRESVARLLAALFRMVEAIVTPR